MTLREQLMDELKDSPLSRFQKERYIVAAAMKSLQKIAGGQVTASPANVEELSRLVHDSMEYVRRTAGLN